MANQNTFMRECVRNGVDDVCMCSEICRRTCVDLMMTNNTGRDMLYTHRRLVSFIDNLHDDKWNATIRTILNGQSLYEMVTQQTGFISFGRGLQYYPELADLSAPEKKILCKTISIIKGIYERWNTIVTNLTHTDMKNVDPRTFSIYELAQAHLFPWVVKYNEAHALKEPKKRKRKSEPTYSSEDLRGVVNAIQSTGILAKFNNDPEQIKLLGNDIINELLRL